MQWVSLVKAFIYLQFCISILFSDMKECSGLYFRVSVCAPEIRRIAKSGNVDERTRIDACKKIVQHELAAKTKIIIYSLITETKVRF